MTELFKKSAAQVVGVLLRDSARMEEFFGLKELLTIDLAGQM